MAAGEKNLEGPIMRFGFLDDENSQQEYRSTVNLHQMNLFSIRVEYSLLRFFLPVGEECAHISWFYLQCNFWYAPQHFCHARLTGRGLICYSLFT